MIVPMGKEEIDEMVRKVVSGELTESSRLVLPPNPAIAHLRRFVPRLETFLLDSGVFMAACASQRRERSCLSGDQTILAPYSGVLEALQAHGSRSQIVFNYLRG